MGKKKKGKLTQTRHAETLTLLDTNGKLARFIFPQSNLQERSEWHSNLLEYPELEFVVSE